MAIIVAVGGGEIKSGETRAADRKIVELSGKDTPLLLFVPTASGDAGGYINAVKRVFHRELGCAFSTLLFYLDDPDEQTLRDKIAAADIIYVGGGNTVKMLDKWREKGLPQLLAAAAARGAVMSGVSAGAMCWYRRGYTDSAAYAANGGEWQFEDVDCLGLLPGYFCPHYNHPDRSGFDAAAAKSGLVGVAVDDCAAVVSENGEIYGLSARDGAGVYLLRGGEKAPLGAQRLSVAGLEMPRT